MVDGYRSVAGSLPPLDMAMFRGAVISLASYVRGEIDQALHASGDDKRHADRSVRHVLSHLPSRAILEKLLDVALEAADKAGQVRRQR